MRNKTIKQIGDSCLLFGLFYPSRQTNREIKLKSEFFFVSVGSEEQGGFGLLEMLRSQTWDRQTLSPMGMPPAEGPPVFLDHAALSLPVGTSHSCFPALP